MHSQLCESQAYRQWIELTNFRLQMLDQASKGRNKEMRGKTCLDLVVQDSTFLVLASFLGGKGLINTASLKKNEPVDR